MTYVKVDGTQRAVLPFVKVDGSQRIVDEAYVKVGGTQRLWFRRLSISLSDVSSFQIVVDPNDAASGVRLVNDGTLTRIAGGGGSYVVHQNWASPPAAVTASEYEGRLVRTSGAASLDVGNLNTWENLGTTRTYQINQTSPGVNTFEGTLQIRDAATQTLQASCTVTMNAEVSV